jgi:hypothetical protein
MLTCCTRLLHIEVERVPEVRWNPGFGGAELLSKDDGTRQLAFDD